MASEEESDIELQSALPKLNNKKMPKSPSEGLLEQKQEKKMSTKEMINQALIDLNSRKGVSLYAIKKYITERYNADTEKLNYIIKKYIKSAVENGSIVQTKGIGASGSFKLVPVKKKTKTDKKPKDKPIKEKVTEKIKEKTKKIVEKGAKKSKTSKVDKEKVIKPKKNVEKDKKIKPKVKDGVEKEKKDKKAKMTKEKSDRTPIKKKNLMKRKSVGSIIKKPKMKPAMKA